MTLPKEWKSTVIGILLTLLTLIGVKFGYNIVATPATTQPTTQQ